MTNAQEKAQAFGIVIPAGVPGIATVVPPQAQSPTAENIQFLTVTRLAEQCAIANQRAFQGYKALIASYRAYGIDPPYPPPPAARIQYYVAADSGGKISDSAAWAMGVPPGYPFPQDQYFWIWDI